MKKSMQTKKNTVKKVRMAKRNEENVVLDTAGGEMPDPNQRIPRSNRKDARMAFH